MEEGTNLFFDKLKSKMAKTKESFSNSINSLFSSFNKVDEDLLDELLDILIMADVGLNTSEFIIGELRDSIKKERITEPDKVKDKLKEILVELLGTSNQEITKNTVYMVVGVNGVGKTTTIAKLASKMKSEQKKVILIAADTYRAGAVEQLKEWALRIGAEFYGTEETDPASVVFDGLKKAEEINADVALIDTAGRLQNKENLMKELEKIKRVIEKVTERSVDETLLVIDASTGQNGISQAVSFKSICDITGLVLTKLDGTAKGGIVLSIKDTVGLPVKFVGFGEKESDLIPFDIESYIYGLFKEWK